MPSSTSPIDLIQDAPALAARLGLILHGLMALVARRFLRQPRLMGLAVPFWSWLSRKRQRFERMVTRPIRVRAPGVAGPVGEGAKRERKPAVAWPRGRGWLVKELGWEAAAYTSQLTALLDDSAMQAALAAMPGLARVLRPVCHVLGVTALMLPVKPRRRRARQVVRVAAPVAVPFAPGWERPAVLFWHRKKAVGPARVRRKSG